MNLQLSLKRKWFELTNSGIKTEDYREITPYWVKRLLSFQNEKITKSLNDFDIECICEDINVCKNYIGELDEEIEFVLDDWYLSFKKFDTTTLTSGYPKKGDTSRIIKFQNKGIEIGYGNPEWGAEPNKLYFIIKHGDKL